MDTKRIGLVGASLVVLACSACTSGSEPSFAVHARAAPAANGPTRVTVLVSDPTTASMDALGGGKLEIVGGCLGASGSVIVWPPGTKVIDNDSLTITIPGKGRFSIGDKVRVGGGYIHEPTSDPVNEIVKVGTVTVPSTCAGKYSVFLAGPNT